MTLATKPEINGSAYLGGMWQNTNKGSKDGNKSQGSSLLLCHHYLKRLLKINFKCLVNKQRKTEDKKK